MTAAARKKKRNAISVKSLKLSIIVTHYMLFTGISRFVVVILCATAASPIAISCRFQPENVVFFEKIGMVKLTDFGFSNLFTPGQQLEVGACCHIMISNQSMRSYHFLFTADILWKFGVFRS